MKRGSGWHNESHRHKLAGMGIKTANKPNLKAKGRSFEIINGIKVFEANKEERIFHTDKELDVLFYLKTKYPELNIIVDDEKFWDDGINVYIYDKDNNLVKLSIDVNLQVNSIVIYEMYANPKKSGLGGKIIRTLKEYIDNTDNKIAKIEINDDANKSFWNYMGFTETGYGNTVYDGGG